MKIRTCKTCKVEFPLTKEFFHSRNKIDKNGEEQFRHTCKKCQSNIHKEYRLKNHETILAVQRKNYRKHLPHIKQYRNENKENIKKTIQSWRMKNKDKIRQQGIEWNNNHKSQRNEWLRQYMRNKYNKNNEFKLLCLMRSRIRKSLKLQEVVKNKRTLELLGCTLPELREHIEKQFSEGMTWDNYGTNGWHIDHIRPCAAYNLTDVEEQKCCFNYKNLKPMWGTENIRKSSYLNGVKNFHSQWIKK